MNFVEPKHYLFKMPKWEAERMTHLTWPGLCRHVKHRFPDAWLSEVEEISFFQLGDIEEIFSFRVARDSEAPWEASLPPFFRQPDTQRHFDSLRLKLVTSADLRRLMESMQENIADLYKETIAQAYRKRRWGKEPELRCPPEEIDIGARFVTGTDFPRLTPFFAAGPWLAIDLLWICKRTDWKREMLVHVYG